MKLTLLLDATLGLAIALLYVRVAVLMHRRPTTRPEAAAALRSFVVWWAGLAVVTVIGSLRGTLAAFDVLGRAPHAFLTYLSVPALVAALWGLVDYLVFIYAGTQRWRALIRYGHAAIAVFFLGLLVWMHPIAVTSTDWTATMTYEHELPGPARVLALILILAPVLAASVAYFALGFRVEDLRSRVRILLVSSAFILWFGLAALASAVGWSAWYWWPLVSRGIALGATLLILLAYHSPRRLTEWVERREVLRLRAARGREGPRLSPAGAPAVTGVDAAHE